MTNLTEVEMLVLEHRQEEIKALRGDQGELRRRWRAAPCPMLDKERAILLEASPNPMPELADVFRRQMEAAQGADKEDFLRPLCIALADEELGELVPLFQLHGMFVTKLCIEITRRCWSLGAQAPESLRFAVEELAARLVVPALAETPKSAVLAQYVFEANVVLGSSAAPTQYQVFLDQPRRLIKGWVKDFWERREKWLASPKSP